MVSIVFLQSRNSATLSVSGIVPVESDRFTMYLVNFLSEKIRKSRCQQVEQVSEDGG